MPTEARLDLREGYTESRMPRSIYQSVCALVLTAIALPAQQGAPERPPDPLTLQAAVEFAERNFPAVHASAAQVAVAKSGIDLAKTAYLPSAGMRLGVNRATRNNVFGLIFPNSVIPGISGPVQEELSATSVFGSSAGVLFSYEPFDLGLRRANVRAAEAASTRAEADRAVTEYEVSIATIDAYLRAVAGQSAVRAAEAGVERMRVFHEIVNALVQSELRPGADAVRAKAELARSRSDLIRAEQDEQTALASLAEWLGLAGVSVSIDPSSLLRDPPAAEPEVPVGQHPIAAAQEAEIAAREARLGAVKKEWRPRFEAQSAVYGRGTGALIDGTFRGGSHGLLPTQGNWAVGFNMNFDLLDFKRNRAVQRIEAHRLEQERARKETVTQELRGEVARARIALQGAREIARNTPLELQAATELDEQEQARYKAGLATVADVADAQLLLRRAEVDDSLARIGVWRALLALAAAQGEMGELLAAASH